MAEKTDFKLLFCIVAVAIIWGTTYLGIRVAVETMQPWYITSLRQGLAALIVGSILLFKKELSWIGWEHFKWQAVASVLMIVVANGFTTIAEQTLPSGLTSILNYINTMIALFLGWLLLNEVITSDFVIATLIIILGVFITNYKKSAR